VTVCFSFLEGTLFGDLNGRHVAVWGLAFKLNSDDLREVPSWTLVSDLFATRGDRLRPRRQGNGPARLRREGY